MADKKVSQLTAKATLDGTELVHVVSDPSGTPVDRKATTQAIADLVTVPTVPALASQAEAEAGVENTKIMTALRVAQAIAALGGGDPGYLEYLAILSQSTTSAPSGVVLENGIGAGAWSRTGVGAYEMVIPGAPAIGEVAIIYGNGADETYHIRVYHTLDIFPPPDVAKLKISTRKNTAGTWGASDNVLSNCTIMLRVY